MSIKTYYIICFTGFLFWTCQQQTTSVSKPNLVLKSEKIDFGSIKNMDTLWQEFSIKNDGNAPLLISDVLANCGCTVPIWKKASIAPNQEHMMKIALIPGLIGHGDKQSAMPFERNIIIRSNIDSIFTKIQVVGVLDNKS